MPNAHRLEIGPSMRVPMMCPFVRELLIATLVPMAPLLRLAMATPEQLLPLALLTRIPRSAMLTALHS